MSDRKGAVTTSLLQKLCHKDDSILLGSWMQDTDHKDVEEQVSIFFLLCYYYYHFYHRILKQDTKRQIRKFKIHYYTVINVE